MIKRMLLVTVAIAGCYLFVATAVVVVALTMDSRQGPTLFDHVRPPENTNGQDGSGPGSNEMYTGSGGYLVLQPPAHDPGDAGGLLRPPARTNFLLIGIDYGNLADAIMVGTFYRDTGQINLMSVPRDLYIRLPAHRLANMREHGLNPPSSLRVNALRSIPGRALGIHFLREQLGEMLGVTFHFYVEVNLSAFRGIVDAIGGVYFHVPHRMFYEDPFQNLVIDLQPGMQRLGGAQAEGLVRYRGYVTADLGRNATQMEFMTQLLRQVLTREAIMNDPLALGSEIIGNVHTNFGIFTDGPRYARYVTSLSADRISTFTMPGQPGYINRASYFLPDVARLPDVVNQVFFAPLP